MAEVAAGSAVLVKAEMGANVWQLSAAVGDTVEEGDVLMILESMKMEIPVEAPSAGTVAEIRVAEKDQVGEGDVLVVLTSGAATLPVDAPLAAPTLSIDAPTPSTATA